MWQAIKWTAKTIGICYGWVTLCLAGALVVFFTGASLMIGSICIITTMMPGGYGCAIQWGLLP